MPWVAFGVAYGLKSREVDKLVFWLRRHAGISLLTFAWIWSINARIITTEMWDCSTVDL